MNLPDLNPHQDRRTSMKWSIVRKSIIAAAVIAAAITPTLAQSPTPPGQIITPTALPQAVQQVLNPGLINYPNFVAGEAIKEAVSPDGKTLAILTAGMNSLFDSNGNVDTAASTQSFFDMTFQVQIRPTQL
jgi:hypothetical protein